MYATALEELAPEERRMVHDALAGWSTDRDRAQVGRNIAAETALPLGDFVTLLRFFAEQLAAGRGPAGAWQAACRVHKFKGRRLGAEACPGVLGRVVTVELLARYMADKFEEEITQEEARRLLYRMGGVIDPGGADEAYLRGSPLGRYLICATFNPDISGANPFDRLTPTRRAFRTAFGLGHLRDDESLVTLVWDHEVSGSPALHRPTVADAEDYPFFRPHREPAAPCGETEPLAPNEDGVGPQPEVVMAVVTGQGLRFPIRIF